MSVEIKGLQRLNFCLSYKEITANYTATLTDDVIGADATGGQITVTLPPANMVVGKQYMIKRLNAGVNNVIVDGDGSELIDQAASITLASQDASSTLLSTGTKWIIL